MFYQNPVSMQPFSDWWVERNDNFSTSATGLFARSPGKEKARPSEGNKKLVITSFAPAGFAIVFLYFSRQQKHTILQGHYCYYFLFSFHREVAGGGSGNLQLFSV